MRVCVWQPRIKHDPPQPSIYSTRSPRVVLSLSAHALEGEPLGGLQRMEVAVAACLLARLDQAAHLVRVRVRG